MLELCSFTATCQIERANGIQSRGLLAFLPLTAKQVANFMQ